MTDDDVQQRHQRRDTRLLRVIDAQDWTAVGDTLADQVNDYTSLFGDAPQAQAAQDLIADLTGLRTANGWRVRSIRYRHVLTVGDTALPAKAQGRLHAQCRADDDGTRVVCATPTELFHFVTFPKYSRHVLPPS